MMGGSCSRHHDVVHSNQRRRRAGGGGRAGGRGRSRSFSSAVGRLCGGSLVRAARARSSGRLHAMLPVMCAIAYVALEVHLHLLRTGSCAERERAHLVRQIALCHLLMQTCIDAKSECLKAPSSAIIIIPLACSHPWLLVDVVFQRNRPTRRVVYLPSAPRNEPPAIRWTQR